MVDKQRGLGRGLAALMGELDDTDENAPERAGEPPREAPIELIRRNPDQPRRVFDEDELEQLTNSIREKGVLQPILVRPAPDAPGVYQIVAGERRWRASQRAGLTSMPVLVRELDDADVLEIAVVENVQRADLNPIEEAQGYRALIERFGRTQELVATAVGKSRSHVANSLRLLNLPEDVREHLAAGRLSAGHARAIATAPEPSALAARIVEEGLNVRQAETLARQVGTPRHERDAARSRPKPPTEKMPDTLALEQDLEDMLGLTVSIEDRGGEGELRVRYASLEQLDDICQRLSKPA
jgi:ParB family chromosome partitioning protein